MKVLNSIPHEQWPDQRMLGEFLFHKLRTVRRFERVIDEIKRSPDDSSLRDFDFLWSRLQEFLVEEREDANAKSIEQSLRGPIERFLKIRRSQSQIQRLQEHLHLKPCLQKLHLLVVTRNLQLSLQMQKPL